MPKSKPDRWYPTRAQLGNPQDLERAFRQLLTQHYTLVDQFNKVTGAQGKAAGAKPTSPFPPGSGPSDSVLLGLPVVPIDTSTLVDGTKLTWVKASGNFQFK